MMAFRVPEDLEAEYTAILLGQPGSSRGNDREDTRPPQLLIEVAKQRIMSLAPPYDPEAVDQKGRKLPEPKFSLPHLRARARVYTALEQWEKALADAEMVLQAELGKAGSISLRTRQLDETEALRDAIKEKMKATR